VTRVAGLAVVVGLATSACLHDNLVDCGTLLCPVGNVCTAGGCDDADCYGRCTPLCQPGTPCDPAAPRCGDGLCGAVEDYAICPVDCPVP
jgi:hypothetical protein